MTNHSRGSDWLTSVSSAVLQWQLLANLYHRQLLARANPFWDMLTNVFCGTSELVGPYKFPGFLVWPHQNFPGSIFANRLLSTPQRRYQKSGSEVLFALTS